MTERLNSADQQGANAPEFTVSELAGAIKRALEEGFGRVRLRGEVSGFKGPHSSGHCYFGLKDDKARIDAVIWRGVFQKLAMKPEEGLEVVVEGRVSAFPGSSKYQIVIESMAPAGAGALMALLEARKKKLAAEGVFDPGRKRKLPFLPDVIGVITSPTGAVIRDITRCLDQRFPVRVLVWPVRVQGETSAAEVTAAIRGFNGFAPGGPLPRPDVLIVARGGGSLEDLWGFNEESVARAAAASGIPLISAVGHETDWTLIDLAADARASTPTMAAEWATPKRADLAAQTGELGLRLGGGARRALAAKRSEWKAASRSLPRLPDLLASPRQRFDFAAHKLGQGFLAQIGRRATRLAQTSGRLPPPKSLVRLPRQRFDACERRLGRALLANTSAHGLRHARLSARLRIESLSGRLQRAGERLSAAVTRGGLAWRNRNAQRRRDLDSRAQLLASLGYRNVLARGYAVVRHASGATKRFAAGTPLGERLEIEFVDGRIDAEAIGGGGEETSAGGDDRGLGSARRTGRALKGARGPGQGSLF